MLKLATTLLMATAAMAHLRAGPTPTPNVHGTNDVTLFIRALYQDCVDSNNDYLASSFLQEPKRTITKNKVSRDLARGGLAKVSQNNVVFFSARTTYLDNLLQSSMDDGIKQVVIVAAGYDSRAYRFGDANPDVQFFEVDLPQVIEAKKNDVAALNLKSDMVEYIGADLANIAIKDALESNDKFVASERTLYLVEGLIYYLPQEAVDNLYVSLGEVAAPGSILSYDFANHCLFEKNCENLPKWEISVFLEVLELKKEPWKSGMEPSEHKEWLADKGFTITEQISFYDAKEKLGVETWAKSPVMSQLNFVTAVAGEQTPEEFILEW